MTQLERARRGEITPEMKEGATAEGVDAEFIRENVAVGRIVILANKNRPPKKTCAIGVGLRTKVNANIGTSPDYADLDKEMAKLRAAEEAGADTVMDLSTGGDITGIRRKLLQEAKVPLGSVPIYEAAAKTTAASKAIPEMAEEDMWSAIENHTRDGIDFITVHCGVTWAVLEGLRERKRICGIVSRGGTFLAEWMIHSGRENPLYEHFDRLLEIAREYDVTLSLGDGLRPGAIADSMDGPQVHELLVLADLAQRAKEAGIQVMIEGPGHVPIDQVRGQVEMEKSVCMGAPFYVLGPIVTDIAPGYDHITAAIGGAIAAAAGADFLCYVTATEHLGLPGREEVREGVIAARIAAHAGDIAKGTPGAKERDDEFSRLRRDRNWKRQIAEALDPKKAGEIRQELRPQSEDVCSMCGEYCVFKLTQKEPFWR
ncbi:MAG: phosphomethylpyrimidine synthase [Planctomycetes bacterium DG_23]|nr:MAG: phosphomethylpyrimidine synthase [Planctomycetes bacterium DG_23]